MVKLQIEQRPRFFGFTYEVYLGGGALWLHFGERCLAIHWRF